MMPCTCQTVLIAPILAEVSDKIPAPLEILVLSLLLTGTTLLVCRLNKWVAYLALAPLACLPALAIVAIVGEGTWWRQAVFAEQGVAYFVFVVVTPTLPFLAALSAAAMHRRDAVLRNFPRTPIVRE